MDIRRNTDGEIIGTFSSDETVVVNAEALRKLINAFMSGNPQTVFKEFVERGNINSNIGVICDNMRNHLKEKSKTKTLATLASALQNPSLSKKAKEQIQKSIEELKGE